MPVDPTREVLLGRNLGETGRLNSAGEIAGRRAREAVQRRQAHRDRRNRAAFRRAAIYFIVGFLLLALAAISFRAAP